MSTQPTSYRQGICQIYPPREGTSSWRVRWYQDGKQRERNFKSQEMADAHARRVDADVKRGELVGDVDLTVFDVAEAYLATLAWGTYQDRQRNALDKWVLPHIGQKKLLAWTPADSKEILRRMEHFALSPAYIRDIGAAMRALVTFAREKRWLRGTDDDPMLGVRYTPTSKVQGESALYIPRSSLPDEEQLQALYAAGKGHWPLAWELAARSGLRWGELVALRPCDFSLDRRTVEIHRSVEERGTGQLRLKTTKNMKVRHSIYPPSLVPRLEAHLEGIERDSYVFHSARGGPMRRPTHRKMWQAAAVEAGWPMVPGVSRKGEPIERSKWTPHTLRHFAACWMLFDLKAEAAQVAYWLGHHSAAFTLARYVGVRGDIVQAGLELTEGW